MTGKGIVHVSSHHPEGELSGAELTRVETMQRRWIMRGYGVAPVPLDGKEHLEDEPLPGVLGLGSLAQSGVQPRARSGAALRNLPAAR